MQKSILTTRKWKGHSLNRLAGQNKFIIWETKFYDIYDQSIAKITSRSNLYSRDLSYFPARFLQNRKIKVLAK